MADWLAEPEGGPRFTGPAKEAMNEKQAQILADITRTRTTGARGPFGPWLCNPEICEPAQQLGRVCRYGTSLSLRESELVILMTAVRHRSRTEWVIHKEEAIKAGLPTSVIDALEAGRAPELSSPREIAIHAFTRSLLDSSDVDDATYASAREELGETAMVEITSISGCKRGHVHTCMRVLHAFVPSRPSTVALPPISKMSVPPLTTPRHPRRRLYLRCAHAERLPHPAEVGRRSQASVVCRSASCRVAVEGSGVSV